MGTKEFGQLADAARKRRDYSLARVAVGVGVLPHGGVLNETQVKRILEGRRALDTFLVERLIAVLDLDRADAWEAALESADLKPPGLTADHLRKLDLVATHSNRVSPEELAQVLTLPSDLDDALVRRLRPSLELVTSDPGRGHASGQYGRVRPTASLDPRQRIRLGGRPHVTPRLIGGDPGFSARRHTPEPTAYPALHERRRRDRRHPRPAPVLPGATPDQRHPRRLEVAA